MAEPEAEAETEYVRPDGTPRPPSPAVSPASEGSRPLASPPLLRRARALAPQVKLISAEGHEFIIDRNAAVVSGTIKSMLQGPGARASRRRAPPWPPELRCCG